MNFKAHNQEQFKVMKIQEGESFLIEYINKDYFNSEETLEKGQAKAVLVNGNICFNVVDPYGMDKLIMEAKIIQKIK